jgi:hypothetical protein
MGDQSLLSGYQPIEEKEGAFRSDPAGVRACGWNDPGTCEETSHPSPGSAATARERDTAVMRVSLYAPTSTRDKGQETENQLLRSASTVN